ncbi:hypothetical protein HYU18_04710 [Candidatus Woesearchaeota archaeon]|nr:hypothetical protein [Candidatus Woesearchaeota archaeon]
MQSINALNKKVFEKARKMPDIHPEMFIALEEYDKTRKLKRWGNKIRVNFTLDPIVYKGFRDYCQKHGYKMSTLVEKAISKAANI